MGLVYPFPWVVMHDMTVNMGTWQKCLVTHYEDNDSTKALDIQEKNRHSQPMGCDDFFLNYRKLCCDIKLDDFKQFVSVISFVLPPTELASNQLKEQTLSY